MPLIVILSLLSIASWGTVTVPKVDCPQQFEGRVQDIIDELGPSNTFSTQKVIFANQRTLKGEIKNQVLVDVLKNGPFELEQGEDYHVQLRDGKVCWLERI